MTEHKPKASKMVLIICEKLGKAVLAVNDYTAKVIKFHVV